MQREIVLDTETTGLDHARGDRIIEIGCVELINRIPTGREFHCFINPEREVPAEAEAVHGLSTAFLADKPRFAAVAEDFLNFIGSDVLVIHNASFDIAFINMELERLTKPRITFDRVVDTLALSRRRNPGGVHNLDALCKRYGIDNSKRTKHGALMDSLLLAEVYVELLGERQPNLELGRGANMTGAGGVSSSGAAAQRPQPLPERLTADDLARHRVFVEGLGETALWRRYLDLQLEAKVEAAE